jgi:hypothetical protein
MSEKDLSYEIIKGLVADIVRLESKLASQIHVNTVFDTCFGLHENRIAAIEEHLGLGKITDPDDAPPHILH